MPSSVNSSAFWKGGGGVWWLPWRWRCRKSHGRGWGRVCPPPSTPPHSERWSLAQEDCISPTPSSAALHSFLHTTISKWQLVSIRNCCKFLGNTVRYLCNIQLYLQRAFWLIRKQCCNPWSAFIKGTCQWHLFKNFWNRSLTQPLKVWFSSLTLLKFLSDSDFPYYRYAEPMTPRFTSAGSRRLTV